MLNLYPPSIHDINNKVKLHSSSFIDGACHEIKDACKGMGTDERTLIHVLGSRSPNDRALIAYRFQELFNVALKDLVRRETSGDFGFLLELLSLPPPEADAFILNYALSGFGTKESLIYPVIMGRTPTELMILKRTYADMYKKDLSQQMESELSGDFKQIITCALQANMIEFEPSYHTQAKAEEDAHRLYKAGEGKWFGTDEESFLKILLASPPQHIEHINTVYGTKHKRDIKDLVHRGTSGDLIQAIDKEFTSHSKDALIFFVRFALEPKQLLAEYFESTMKGLTTDEKCLSAAVIRYQSLLPLFSGTYERMNKKTLQDRIKGETSGDYGNLLLTVLNAPTSSPINP